MSIMLFRRPGRCVQKISDEVMNAVRTMERKSHGRQQCCEKWSSSRGACTVTVGFARPRHHDARILDRAAGTHLWLAWLRLAQGYTL